MFEIISKVDCEKNRITQNVVFIIQVYPDNIWV